MGLITSTGLFKYIPPNPKITSTSSPTGDLGQIILINGEDLDYVDTLSFAGENLNFNLININQGMNFIVPSNPSTGKLVIASNNFEITGENNLPFLPIFTLENFTPLHGSEDTTINIQGKVLTSIQTGYIYASPILDDINFYFSGESNTFSIPMSTISGVADINLSQNINLNAEQNNFKISKVNNFNFQSGKLLNLNYNITGNLNQKYYENHLFSVSGKIANDFQSFKTGLLTGNTLYNINIPSGLNNNNYAVFYNLIQSGTGYQHSYISDKTISSFKLNLSSSLVFPSDLNVFLINTSGVSGEGFVFDSGVFVRNYIDTSGSNNKELYFYPINDPTLPNLTHIENNLYPPFLFTSIEKISGVNINNTYESVNIFNLKNNKFSVNIPNATNGVGFRLNYLAIYSSGANLSTFEYQGSNSYYKKIYLITGDQNTFQERIPLKNLIINDKNNLSFQIPETDYYINGKIELVNFTGISKNSLLNFTETPTPLAILPASGSRGSNIMIEGKSFKKPILIDSPYQYDNCFVRFRYADNLYSNNNSTFETSMRIISKNVLSGFVPLSNIPTGRYAIQMIDEKGGLFE